MKPNRCGYVLLTVTTFLNPLTLAILNQLSHGGYAECGTTEKEVNYEVLCSSLLPYNR